MAVDASELKTKTEKDKKQESHTKPVVFTPEFRRHLGSLSGTLLGNAEAAKVLRSLQSSKTIAERQAELHDIFCRVANKMENRPYQDNDEAWAKLNSMFGFIAPFDKLEGLNKQLENARSQKDNEGKKNAFLAMLKSRAFAEHCAKFIALASQEQIEAIINHTNKFFTTIASQRAQQSAYSDWGQFGVKLLEYLYEVISILAAQNGFDVTSSLPSDSDPDSKPTFIMQPGKT